mgnify:CR=1 FL=1
MFIESAHNKIAKQTVSLQNKKNRDEQQMFVVEGFKQVSEIPKDWEIEYIICTEKYKDRDFGTDKIYFTTDLVFSKLSQTKTPQGVLAAVKKKSFDFDDVVNRKGIFVIADNLQDPGNLGSIIRTSQAYDCKGIFLSKNTADAFSSKVLRSAMGAIFNIPVFQECDINELIEKLKLKNIKTYALAVQAKQTLCKTKFENNTALIVGNESAGIDQEILNKADAMIKIEMFGKTQSLNAAAACSIAIYEISKQINAK